MSKRLGEVLIERGIIDEARLKMGLDAQLIYGGHLGTCLVELGFVDLETLGQTLAGSFNVEHAHRDLLEGIPEEVLKMLPATLVEKHRVIPFEIDGRVLRVAMVDPRNLLALDELSFASGCKIEPWVAPEILVVRAMELYYKVSRRLRHIAVSGSRPNLPHRPRPAASPAATPVDAAARGREARVAAPPPAAPAAAAAAPPREARVASSPAAAPAAPAVPAAVAAPATVATTPPSDPLPPPVASPAATGSPAAGAGAPPPVTASAPAQVKPAEETVPLPSLERPRFVPQMARSYPQAANGASLMLDWIKLKPSEDQPERWCDLFRLDLDQSYFDDLEGVCVVWYHGRQPVLRVGHGKIRMLLQAMQQNDELIELAREHTVYASWSEVPADKRTGVERYLIEMLNPRVHMHLPPVDPVAVNLPR